MPFEQRKRQIDPVSTSQSSKLYPNDIKNLLNSNRILSSEEETKINALRTDTENEVVNLIAEIAQCQEIKRRLKRRLDSRAKELDDYTVILSPVRRLPYDVLCEIFLSSLYNNPDSRSSSTHLTDTPWTLTFVSSHWRSVALSFPQLWSTIRVIDEDCLPLLDVQLERSGSHPLSVSLIETDRGCWSSFWTATGRKPEDTPPVLQKLLSLSHRWRALHIFFNNPQSFNGLSHFPLQLQSLNWVSIRTTRRMPSPWDLMGFYYEDSRVQPYLVMSTLFKDCPSLRKVGGQPHALSVCSFQWSQIKEYECNVLWYMPHYLKLLALLPNLQKCRISSESNSASLERDDWHGTSNQIVLQHLEYLSLSESASLSHPKTATSLFNHLTLPSLTTLKFDRTLHEMKVDPLIQFFNRSQCPLTTLDLKVCNLSDEEYLDILEALPTLKTLITTRSYIRTVKFLSQIILEPTLVPLLQLVEIRYNAAERYDAVDISKLKNARPCLRLRQTRQVIHYY